jgi:tetraacyldisaccharide 4'-kinase
MLLRVRAWAYAVNILPSRRLDRPVISVGNITVGGTGKTPMTALIARYLMDQGKRVAVLSRGYGGTSQGEPRIVSDGAGLLMSAAEAGDEPCLLAKELPGLMVVIGHDRYEAGRVAERELHPDLFILDDGFQHLRLQRDLNIVLLDGRNPFGNGLTLPAGLLREPRSALKRADLFVLTRSGAGCQYPTGLPDGRPVLRASHKIVGLAPAEGGSLHPFSELNGERVLAFAGIADPAGFAAGLVGQGVVPIATQFLPDHMNYGEREIADICRLRDRVGATCMVTTAKDAVKLSPFLTQLGTVWVAVLEIDLDDSAELTAALDSLFAKASPL